jgi:hypothetical protein
LAHQQYLVREREGDLNASAQDGKLAHQQYLVRERDGDLNASAQDGKLASSIYSERRKEISTPVIKTVS